MPARARFSQPDLLGAILGDLVEPPDDELDRALDAAAACLARHGVAHTTVPLLARHLGLSRATVYGQFGTVADVTRLVLIRDFTRFAERLPPKCREPGPAGVIALCASAIRFGREHSIITKVLADEPTIIGELLPHAGPLITVGRRPLARYLQAGMQDGSIRPGEPDAVADVIVRVVLTAIAVRPPGRLTAYLEAVLGPLIAP